MYGQWILLTNAHSSSKVLGPDLLYYKEMTNADDMTQWQRVGELPMRTHNAQALGVRMQAWSPGTCFHG